MWQVCLRFTPRWTTELKPVEAWTGLVVCGLHKDEVTLDELGETPTKIANSFTNGHADALIREVWFLDISNGKWVDPSRPGQLSPV